MMHIDNSNWGQYVIIEECGAVHSITSTDERMFLPPYSTSTAHMLYEALAKNIFFYFFSPLGFEPRLPASI